MIKVEGLTKAYQNNKVVDEVDIEIETGKITSFIGPNGAGKTTLINILMDLLDPTAGNYKFSDQIKLGYVPQFRNIDQDYPLSIKAFVGLNAPLIKNKEVKKQIEHQLQETNLTGIQNTRMGRASGGQKQRAYLAQALLDHPNMIILDEATASLDPVAKQELMNLIDHLNKKHNMTVLFVTHDVALAKKYMNDYLYLDHASIRQGKMADFKEDYE